MLEGILVFTGIAIGTILMLVVLFIPQSEIGTVQTDSFLLNCSSNKVFPVYLQKDDKFNYYLTGNVSSKSFVSFDIKNINENKVIGISKYQGNPSRASLFIPDADGFYKL